MSLDKLKRRLFRTKLAARRARHTGIQYGNPTWRFIEKFFQTFDISGRRSKRSLLDHRKSRIG